MIYLKLRLRRKPFCLNREIKVNYYILDASFVFFKRPATPLLCAGDLFAGKRMLLQTYRLLLVLDISYQTSLLGLER